jgi:hypothetical protein
MHFCKTPLPIYYFSIPVTVRYEGIPDRELASEKRRAVSESEAPGPSDTNIP